MPLRIRATVLLVLAWPATALGAEARVFATMLDGIPSFSDTRFHAGAEVLTIDVPNPVDAESTRTAAARQREIAGELEAARRAREHRRRESLRAARPKPEEPVPVEHVHRVVGWPYFGHRPWTKPAPAPRPYPHAARIFKPIRTE